MPYHKGEFDWSAERQGVILGSFYYGYALSHVPGGILAERYGGKWIFGLCTGAGALVTVAVPLIARAREGRRRKKELHQTTNVFPELIWK